MMRIVAALGLSQFVNPLVERLRGSPLGQRFARGVFWSISGTVVSRVMALVGSVIVARSLGRELFGEIGVLQSTVNMFATFAVFGLGLTATKHVAEFRISDPIRAGNIIGLSNMVSWTTGSVVALVVFLLAPWLAVKTLALPELTDLLRVCALCLLFTVVNEAQCGALDGFEAFRRRSAIQAFGGVVSFLMIIVGVYGWGLKGVIWAMAISQGILVFLNFRGIHAEARKAGLRIKWRGSLKELRVLWEFSVPTVLGAAFYVPAMWLANVIIVNYPDGYAQMGLFSAADRWRVAILFLPSALGGVALPILSNILSTGDIVQYKRVLRANVRLGFLISLTVAFVIAALSPWIMAGYGADFADGRWILVGLCGLAVITSTSWLMTQALVSEGRMWLVMVLNALWALLLVGSCWVTRAQGAKGLLTAYLVADGIRLLVVMFIIGSNNRVVVQSGRSTRGVEMERF